MMVFKMSPEIEVLGQLSRIFMSLNIPFMLSGSMAMGFFTVPRMTRDLDIVAELTGGQLESLHERLQADYYFDKEAALQALKIRRMFNILHNKTGVKVDIIIRKDSDFRRLEFERRQKIVIEGFETYIVTIEDLILSKLYWAKDSLSEMQMRDIQSLCKARHDRKYVEKWVNLLGLEKVYERAFE